jgi:D-alanyl-D-alanine carboxypeptidase (penicillin-binding protein 5/6)
MKKIVSFLLVMIIPLFFCPVTILAAAEPAITAPSAILIDAKTGQVLYEKNADDKLPPASITKIMTMLIAVEKIEAGELSLSDPVTVSAYAANMGGSQLYLEAGEVRTVEELFYGIAVESGNDAATALAEHIGGSIDGFVALMNARAAELGMTNTHFCDACGLTEEGHYTTARDIATMSAELLKHDLVYTFTTTWMKDIYVGKNNDVLRTLVNTNKLISQTTYVDGIKTGYSSFAKYCLSATAQRGDLRLISVVLGVDDSAVRFTDAKALLDFGFANYSAEYIFSQGDAVGQVHVYNAKEPQTDLIAAQDIYKLVPANESLEYETEIILNQETLYAPIEEGESVGIFKIIYANGETAETELIIKDKVDKISWFGFFREISAYLLP